MGVVKNTLLWGAKCIFSKLYGHVSFGVIFSFIWEIPNDLYIILRDIVIGSSLISQKYCKLIG